MASLYKSTQNARKFVIVFLVFVLGVFAFEFISGFFSSTPEQTQSTGPRPYLPANRTLGDVPPPVIPGINYSQENLMFNFRGFFPEFPDISYVYEIEEPSPGFFRFDQAQTIAEILGFNPESFTTNDNTNYTWQTSDGTKTLRHNTIVQSWEMDTDISANPAALARKTVGSLERYTSQARNVLNRLNFNTYGLDEGEVTARYAEVGLDDIFLDVLTEDDAEYVFVDIFREIPQADLKSSAELRNLPEEVVAAAQATAGKVYGADPRFGQVSLITSNQLRDLTTDIFRVRHTEFEYNEISRGVYQIITPLEAWDDVQQNEGSLVYLRVQGQNYFAEQPDSVTIQSFTAEADETELAFYEPTEWDRFVYPIYVFRGTALLEDGRQASFIFYVDAIKRL